MPLTIQQQRVVDSTSKRILVLSCAGSGKTTVITKRISKLLELGVKPEEVLALTFSNKAAQEMKKRISKDSPDLGSKVNVKTFHAFGLEIVKKYNVALGFSGQISISKPSERKAILNAVLRKHRAYGIEGNDLGNYIKLTKSCENFYRKVQYDPIVCDYIEEFKKHNLVDMEDMIWLPVCLLSKEKKVRAVISGQYKYVFVDEYQDTNEAQNRLLDLIVSEETHVCLVGDDDQAIYEWRGAKPHYIRDKAQSGKYEIIKLETNFRSQAGIIDVANLVISKNQKRVKKEIKADLPLTFKPIYKRLPTEEDEAKYVAEKIGELVNNSKYNPSDIAVLVAANSQAEPIKEELTKVGIGCDLCEIDENAQYSRFVSVLQSIVNLDSSVIDLGNAINFPYNCFDNFVFTDAKTAYCDCYGQGCSFTDLEWINKLYLSDVDFENCDEFRERYELITQLNRAKTWRPTQTIAVYISFMKKKRYDLEYPEQYQFVLQVFNIAHNYEEAFGEVSLSDFLTHLKLSMGMGDTAKSANYDAVNVLTMHRAKGLEFKVVFIVGVQVGLLPNDYFVRTQDDLEAQRRLFYVAITRAKELLFLSSYKDPFGGSRKSPVVKNGFLAEIPQISFADEASFNQILHTPQSKRNEARESFTAETVDAVINNTIEKVSAEFSVEPSSEFEELVDSNHISNKGLKDVREADIDNSRFDELILALSREVEVPSDKFVVIVGARDIKTNIVQGILKANSFGKGQYELYDYHGSGFKLSKYFNNPRCIGIVLGPEAHKMEGVSASSLKAELMTVPGYPYMVSLIHEHITKASLQKALVKIKWNYEQNKKQAD